MRQLYVYMNDLKAGVLTENTPGKEYTFSVMTRTIFQLKTLPFLSLFPKERNPIRMNICFLSSRTCCQKVLTVGAFAVR